MSSTKPILAVALSAAVGISPAHSLAAPAPSPRAHGAQRAQSASVPVRSLTKSRHLWATVDVCGPADKPSTIGVRGSMPSDGHPKDVMYMRFRVQYLDAAGKSWANVTHGGDSGTIKVGRANAVRQAGVSFQFASQVGKATFTLRGLVTFEWRRGAAVVATQSRTTSAGHHSIVGSDPPGFSSATCKLS